MKPIILQSYAFEELNALWIGESHKHWQRDVGVNLESWGQSGS